MAFIVRNVTGSPVVLDDLGITIPALSDYDLTPEQANDVAVSDDLVSAIAGGDVVVLDPVGGSPQGVLSTADGIEAVRAHNDPHIGIRQGYLDQLRDVDLTGIVAGDVLRYMGSPAVFAVVPASEVGNDISLDDLNDVDDATAHTNGVVYVFQGDGTNLDVVDAAGNAALEEVIEDVIGGAFVNGTDTTFVYNDGAGTLQVNVDDSFLRNDGDTLDSGTLTIASGASINVANGADLTIQDAPVNPQDAVNKAYVDSVAAGLDPKESVFVATTAEIGGSPLYSFFGSPQVNEINSVDKIIDDVELFVGARVLVKNQVDLTKNGIYEAVATAGSPATFTLRRADDQDGTPDDEVSAGNFTFVEQGTVNANTGWVVIGQGNLEPDVDNIVWVQFSESTQLSVGLGLSMAGTVVDLDLNDLTAATITLADEIGFHDQDGTPSSTGSQTRNTSVADFISDLGIVTDPNANGLPLTASDGVRIEYAFGSPQTNDIQLDITNLPSATIVGADELVFDDGASGDHAKTTVTNFLADLDIVNNLGGNGIAVQTASDTYTARSVVVNGPGSLDGLAVTNGDGVAGNITLGLDINGLPARSDLVDPTDRVPVYNITTGANEYYTVSEISGAVTGTDSFNTWQGAGNTTGTSPAAIVADSSTDTATLVGGVGINLNFDGVNDEVEWSFGNFGMADTAVTLTDTVPFFDASNASDPEFRSFQNVFSDLDVPFSITANGLVTRTGSDTYASRSVAVDGVGLLDGLAVANGDGVAGNPTVGLDISGTPAAGEEFAAGDSIVAVNTSASANQRFTGQEVADGVFTIQGLGGLTVTTIGGQEILTLVDTTRANKVLSVETVAYHFDENGIGNLDWIGIGNAVDANSGYVIPHNATIVKAVMHTVSTVAKAIDLYVDGTNVGALLTFTGTPNDGSGEFVSSTTINTDVNAGQKIRLRGSAVGTVGDITVTVYIKWRG